MRDETIAIHLGYESEPTTHAVAVPLYQTVAYEFDDAQHGADLFDLAVPGNIYTRIMNPTQAVLEERVAQLERGVAALALSSGSAAVNYSILNLAVAGDNVVSVPQLYGGTYTLFAHMLPQQGIEVRFAEGDTPDDLAKLIDDRTKAVFCESIGNPAGNIVDLAARLRDGARPRHRHHRGQHGGDARAAQASRARVRHHRPLADQVHGRTRQFARRRHRGFGPVPLDRVRGALSHVHHPRAELPRRGCTPRRWGRLPTSGAPAPCRSATPAPPSRRSTRSRSCRGSRPLSLRMERHCENALAVARHLSDHPKVEWVNYAGLPGDRYHDLAVKYLGGSASGILTFGVEGGFEAGVRFYNALGLFKRLVNIGDAKSLACHPASTTHRQLTPEEQLSVGVRPEAIRLSVGIEHIADIVEDLDQALAAA